MNRFDTFLDWVGHKIAARLTDDSGYEPITPSDPATLEAALRPADVLLVAGGQKIATAIKYLTQSTWSHSALYVGDALGASGAGGSGAELNTLIEVNLGEGCVARPLSKYARFNTRICRPIGLMEADRRRVVNYMVARLGTQYDMRNIFDLLRYLMPTPPVPVRWRRRMISMGTGEPTRSICSTLIAQAFQDVRYPILPRVERVGGKAKKLSRERRRQIYHIRHHSLFAPADFDMSPYFQIVKPTIEHGFDYKSVIWSTPGKTAAVEDGKVSADQDAKADAVEEAKASKEPVTEPGSRAGAVRAGPAVK